MTLLGRRTTGGRPDEEGAAAITAIALVAVLLALVGAALVLSDVLAARQRAAAAADLGALAGVPGILHSDVEACASAAWVVERNGAVLRSCTIVDGDVRITVSCVPRGPWARWLGVLGTEGPVVSAHAGTR